MLILAVGILWFADGGAKYFFDKGSTGLADDRESEGYVRSYWRDIGTGWWG